MARRKYVRKTAHKKAPSTAFKPGDPRINRKGRVPGVPNKFSGDLKQMILNSLAKAGGENWFFNLAKAKDKRTFAQLVSRLLPTKLAGHDGGPLDADLDRFKAGLANLSEKELASFQDLMKKIRGEP